MGPPAGFAESESEVGVGFAERGREAPRAASEVILNFF